jgi:hypothetical protein
MNWEVAIEQDDSQTIISDHPLEGIVKYVTGCPEWYSKTQPGAVGTSSQPPPPKKDKK